MQILHYHYKINIFPTQQRYKHYNKYKQYLFQINVSIHITLLNTLQYTQYKYIFKNTNNTNKTH